MADAWDMHKQRAFPFQSKRFVWFGVTVFLGYCWSLLLHQLDDAVTYWANEQIAHYLGIASPSVEEVIKLIWDWGLPLALGASTLFAYHKWHEATLRQNNAQQLEPRGDVVAQPTPIVRTAALENKVLKEAERVYVYSVHVRTRKLRIPGTPLI